MASAAVGQLIEYRHLPGFRMKVLRVKPCDAEFSGNDVHVKYKIRDPEGKIDWLCGKDCIIIMEKPSITPTIPSHENHFC